MPNQNRDLRTAININLKNFIRGTENGKPLVKMMAGISGEYPAYGVANELDFRELTPLFERLFAYDNKHYYIYKAVENPNKIGYLSCKQYKKLNALKKILSKNCIAGSRYHDMIERFMSRNGTMASPYKLLKRAFKENKDLTRFIGRFFPLLEDGKTTKNEDALIRLCDEMMQFNTEVEIKDATVQECYDLDFQGSNINNSGERHCANSCMYGRKVGAFYDAFGAHGKMVYYRGRPVGRFLLWDLPDGKQYVDRLYVRGEYINEVLAKIDSEYPDENCLKYPYLRQHNIPVAIKCSHVEALDENPQTPYIDTFAHLHKKIDTGEFYLSNTGLGEGFRSVATLRRTKDTNRIKCCPYCHRMYWTGDRSEANQTKHRLVCEGYKPRERKLRAYLETFRKYAKLKKEAANAKREFIFQV